MLEIRSFQEKSKCKVIVRYHIHYCNYRKRCVGNEEHVIADSDRGHLKDFISSIFQCNRRSDLIARRHLLVCHGDVNYPLAKS